MALDTCKVHDFVLSASALSAHSLDLSRKEIIELPTDLPGCEKLECLYLEGNKLTALPESLFESCPNLRWLDLRNNRLTSVPPSIEKLKCLRTLLLEGNQLYSLPPQLSKLKCLTGLNLTKNPLEVPPKPILQRGTKAVLKYLNGLLKESDDGNSNDSNSESSTALCSGSTTTLSRITHTPTGISQPERMGTCTSKSFTLGLPLPLLQQAPLHTLPSQANKNKHISTLQDNTRDNLSEHPKSRNKHKAKSRAKKANNEAKASRNSEVTKDVRKEFRLPQLSTEEKLEISVTIEKKKAEDGLKIWRDKARELQRKQDTQARISGHIKYHKAQEIAPFATDECSCAIGTQGRTLSDSSTDSLRDVREAEVKARVNRHMFELAALRKQAGLISTPSNELLQAEKKLAKAITKRKEVEMDKSREYRLTAFTGDVL